jgi:hypothetical protein
MAPAHAVTIARAAQILHENEQLLWDLAIDMDPEDGCLWIYGTDEQETLAFTDHGLEYLRELVAEQTQQHLCPVVSDRLPSLAWTCLRFQPGEVPALVPPATFNGSPSTH